jgi:hypothetical protein
MDKPMAVWVFQGERSRFPSAIFSRLELAEQWIQTQKVTGILTKYPIDISVYDWAIHEGVFAIKREDQMMPSFIQRFTSASQEHYHYQHGTRNNSTLYEDNGNALLDN